MLVAKIYVSKTEVRAEKVTAITSGMVGAEADVYFDRSWDGYAKTYVWEHNGVVKDDVKCSGIIPHEVVAESGGHLRFGVYGTKNGTKVTPTLWCNVDIVKNGTDPTGDESTAYTLPVWAQIRDMVGNLDDLDTEAKENLVAAVNEALVKGGGSGGAGADGEDGGYYTPAVTQPDDETVQFDFTPSKVNMPAVEPVQVKLPIPDSSQNGADGITPHIGENGNWYLGDTDTGVKATGDPGAPGADGEDGVGIKSIARTSGDGSPGTTDTYTITYTDNNTSNYTVYNGKDGVDGTDGSDYVLTDEDKTEIADLAAQKVPNVTTPEAPLFANDVSEMTDTSKVYVSLETGTFWQYKEATFEKTVVDVIESTDDNPVYEGQYVNKDALSTKADSFATPFIDLTKYSGTIRLIVKGATCLSDAASSYNQMAVHKADGTYIDRCYMSLATQSNAYVVTLMCSSLDKVVVDGDTTTLTIDLPRYFTTTLIEKIRFGCVGTWADSQISIEYEETVTETAWVDTGILYAPKITEEEKQQIADDIIARIDTELLSVVGSGEVV